MKTLLITAAVSATMLSCTMKSDQVFPVNFTAKDGKGIIKTKQYDMSFDEIKVAQSISAEVVKSDIEKVVITAPSDILDDILVDNVDGKLFIHFKPHLNISARNVAAKIFVKDFTHLEATSSARIAVKDKFTQDKTDVEVSSSGSITGNLEANDLSVDVSSSGSFSGQIWAVNLKSQATSSGEVNFSGKTKNAEIQVSSSGTIAAKNLTADLAEIQASSSGSVSLSVADQLNASASSSGDISVYRKGNLNVISQNESSGGNVTIQ
ncbi:MAG: head GIN domain-containing protein [Kaistella sp.]